MYESGVNPEGVDYNSLFCQACLSSNRALTAVGDYTDIYQKICENSRLNITPQMNLCWECMTLLKKVRAFKRKIENAQKILDYCVNKQAPLEDNSLSDLAYSSTELTTFIPILVKNEDDYDDLNKSLKEFNDSYKYEPEKHIKAEIEECSDKDELMIRIEDVRGQCDIVDVKPGLDVSGSSACAVKVKQEPLTPEESEEEQRYRRWKRSVMLVYKRICGHKYARYFQRPVTDDVAPLYSRVVRRPIDLTTIKRRVRDGLIRTTEQFRHALLLMYSNALMYNGSDFNIYHMTKELREETIRELEILAAAEAHADSPPFTSLPPRRRALSPRVSPPPRSSPPALPVVPASPPSVPAPRKRRWDLEWPEHEHLVAVKKYKSTVLLF